MTLVGSPEGNPPDKKQNSQYTDMHLKVINITFETVTMPDNTLRCTFIDLMLPTGYKVNSQGVYKRITKNNRRGWRRITSVPCTISAISQDAEHGICSKVRVAFVDGSGCNVWEMWISTAQALSRKVAGILRENGAICTDSDSEQLADYFRECYMMRLKEVTEGW
ncbi:hypothetical protein [Methanolobus sp. WCC5]|uniref:hypothetical protein n=1 Tax=Methanolobus sp. WCC5 TaxID=3125785 RepID=UPI00324CE118